MHIAIIGASRGVGYEATLLALNKGYIVTVLSSHHETLPDNKNLIKIKGSATNPKDVATAIKDTDAVLITIGTQQKKNTTLFSSMAKSVVTAWEELYYDKPILVVSGFGVGKGYPYANLFTRLVIRFFLKDQYKDKELMEEIFANSRSNWEMVQPGMLTNTPLTSSYKTFSSFFKGMRVGKISRADLADFMIKEAVNPQYRNKKVVVTY
ncbi:NAD(P)H-binding protein [Chryseobacterium sp.]|jgi:putative NADH-flavin reductase|uniref:NAD(P)-dependent oxidoreductase n=1 Tax=Chryseobacterium sp. TaxID=1871047 RepID=UPI00284D60E1|nr:NAD(P)H-binding protein [Chryseobacterium sp.]MDR3025011.1 NAD(P)H-binding protein [Chryseobacterium sp.]